LSTDQRTQQLRVCKLPRLEVTTLKAANVPLLRLSSKTQCSHTLMRSWDESLAGDSRVAPVGERAAAGEAGFSFVAACTSDSIDEDVEARRPESGTANTEQHAAA
jgi:hypothetical protein